jgi:hypothetical protein
MGFPKLFPRITRLFATGRKSPVTEESFRNRILLASGRIRFPSIGEESPHIAGHIE